MSLNAVLVALFDAHIEPNSHPRDTSPAKFSLTAEVVSGEAVWTARGEGGKFPHPCCSSGATPDAAVAGLISWLDKSAAIRRQAAAEAEGRLHRILEAAREAK